MIRNYLKVALRNIGRHKVYSVINIFGLALGIATSVVIFLYVQNELSYDRYHKNSDRIFRVQQRGFKGTVVEDKEANPLDLLFYKDNFSENRFDHIHSSNELFEMLRDSISEVQYVTRIIRGMHKTVISGDSSFSARNFYYADSTFFNIFSCPIILGDKQKPLKHERDVVISRSTAKKFFGDANPLGKTMVLNHGWKFRVSAVCEDVPENSHIHFDYMANIREVEELFSSTSWLQDMVVNYLKLKKDVDSKAFQRRLNEIVRKHKYPELSKYLNIEKDSLLHFENKENIKIHEAYLMPITDIHLHSDCQDEFEANSNIAYIYIFSAVAIIVLLLACINFMNLTTARSATRAKEVGMRKVIGATRRQLIRQFLVESVFLSFLAMLLALAFIEVMLPFFNRWLVRNLEMTYSTAWELLILLFGGAFLIGIISGSYPAFFLSSFRVLNVLRGRITENLQDSKLRSALVLFQFTVSIALLICTFLVHKQISYIKSRELGFAKNHIVVVERAYSIMKKYDDFKADLLQHPDIKSVSISNVIPGHLPESTMYFVHDTIEQNQTFYDAYEMQVDSSFFATMQIELINGHLFNDDTINYNQVIINETARKQFGIEYPLEGKTLSYSSSDTSSKWNFNIVGVVKDFNYQSLHKKVEPLVIHKRWKMSSLQYIPIRINSRNAEETIDYIQQSWENYAKHEPFDYFFLEEKIDDLYRSEQMIGSVFTVFTVIAIFIACLGLFGQASFAARKRTKEIGIRKALGASTTNIVLLLSKEFARRVLIANLFAWPLAYFFIRRWLDGFSYHVPVDFFVFVYSAIIALIIAIFTVSFQAFKAANQNPSEAIIYE